ncbi:unnamed protein product [Alopecurus aequalis]
MADETGDDDQVVHGCETVDPSDEAVHGDELVQGSELAQVDELTRGDEVVQGEELTQGDGLLQGHELTTPRGSRPRKRKSLVWEHFTVEDAAGGATRACCKLCKQSFAYCSSSKIAVTSHLKRHIALGSCTKIYDQDRSCSYLAKMVILHDYPLHIVQQSAFTAFIDSLQPRFGVVDVDAMEGEVYAIYQKEKENLLQAFSTMPGRMSLCIGLWTTSQSLGYVSLAGQFIDSEWKLHRRMLNFMMVSSHHSENALSEAISASLTEWSMKDKLFTITLDNDCSSHDIYSANLRDHLSNKNDLNVKGQLFVVRCYAAILNAVAQDVIASIHGTIYNIRESIKFIKASTSREEKFAEITLHLEIPSTKTLCLDVTTQWNTTYLMLLAALDYKQAFTQLETSDDNYNESPSAEDWKRVETACSYLRLLYDSAHSIMVASNPTSNIFFHEAWKLHLELANASGHQDPVFSSIARDMHERFDKYWKDCNLVLAVAVVMDPRLKMKLIEFSYSKIYGVEAAKYVKVVSDSVHELYKDYVAQLHGKTDNAPANGKNTQTIPHSTGDGLLDFDMYLSETATSQPLKSELEQYLDESLTPRIQEFDILNWWKLNTLRFPTLSRMARDILAIPMSMVTDGSSIFSAGTGSRMLDDYRSSLRPEIVEALVCAKDWLPYAATATTEAASCGFVKMD